ncbi:UNVERIFIED_CONTAM: Retrovirus-related Pol polyprotein from type-1 retrotransposable element R2 [Sesamum latifolium]|uniref:Retrovirus-related Pol polyprotein from type-1 retrotransposable element R2 n=1 Tax=Sesamum latifolium TaxID=2727402 RepID=A0AAW2XQW7_9LAMI
MFLQPWARYIIPNDERETMIRPVEREEIKAAFFDIDEDKALGPDGFSAGFFKAAWSVIGDELTTAIQDFFGSGKMLKQVNATILSLIPKVANPTTVVEFRPISCCNVLYKAITKIIVQRMHAVMGKIVSPSQNAFVPGRRISNNTLIGQELFHGYNRQNLPPRCALKVDLWEAYDTLEWDFIHAMLSVFDFPEKMIMWIVECISTTTYSVSLNGELHGFFPGARGIRQGDPMSPYLFVLAMEILHLILLQRIEQAESFQYHWQCNEMKLFNLCFADDLLLFCKAEENSVILFHDALHAFAELSGLHANISKSQLILSKSATPVRDRLRTILGFQEGQLSGWSSLHLSFAARIQLLKSVISALNIYWATAFILPSGVLKTIEARMRKFLWQGGHNSGAAKVAWVDVCKPLEEGGQGLRRLQPLNHALIGKHFWDIIQCNESSIWVMWITNRYLRHCSVWTARVSSGSWSWRKILKLRSQLLGPLIHRFPNGPRVTGIPLSLNPQDLRLVGMYYYVASPHPTELLHLMACNLGECEYARTCLRILEQRFGSDCQGLVGNTPSYGRLGDGEVNTRGMPFPVHCLPRWFIPFGWNETSEDLGMNPLFRNVRHGH